MSSGNFLDVHNFFSPTYLFCGVYIFIANHKVSNYSFPSITKSGSKARSYSYAEKRNLEL